MKGQQDFVTELKKLNTTISMIPPGGTGYVQVCNSFTNKKIKELIRDYKSVYYDQNEAKWKASKFTISERRVLLTE